MLEEERENPERIREKENLENKKTKRRRINPLLRKPPSKKPKNRMLLSVKEEEEEPVKVNSECYFKPITQNLSTVK